MSEGVLDLSSWDFSDNGPVDLSGQYEFYWKQLLSPSDFADPATLQGKSFTTLPSLWEKEETNNQNSTLTGYATYHLHVKLPPTEIPLALRIADAMSAYRLWINGTLRHEEGIVSTLEAGETEGLGLLSFIQLTKSDLAGNSLELVLQVSNYHHTFGGGFYSPITLATVSELTRSWDIERGFLIVFTGIMLFMVFFHLVFFFSRVKDRSPLYFSLFCLFWVVAIVSSASHRWLFFFLFPHSSLLTASQVELFCYYYSIPFTVLFFQSIFPDETPPCIGKIHVLLAIILSGSLFISPVALLTGYVIGMALLRLFFGNTTQILLWHILLPPALILLGLFVTKNLFTSNGFTLFYVGHIISGFAICSCSIILIKAWKNGRRYANLLLAGGAVLALSGVGDILTTLGFMQTPSLTPGGILILSCCQAAVLALRFSSALKSTESMSLQLQKKNIELEKLDVLKDEFFANTSHELRTPLSGIIGITESIIAGAAGKLPQAAVHNLQMVVASSRRLTTLVNDILDFSRLKNTDISLNLKPVDLYTLVDVVCAGLNPLAHSKGLQLINAIEESLPAVYGDEDRLQQVFYNIIGNAIKFTNTGSVTVSGALHTTALEICITDTGVGIPRNKLKDIFLSYEQVDSTASREFGGTGLGLYITKHLIELHKGEINVESDCDRGTTFTLLLPLADSVPDKFPSDADPQHGSSHSGSKFLPAVAPAASLLPTIPATTPLLDDASTILVVDDEPVNLQVAVNQLSFAGFTVHTASDGHAALSYCEKTLPDLLLLDIMMPGITGYQVCHQLREEYSSSRLPIIMLTAKNRISDLVSGFEAGANDYLTKPFSREELLSRVQAQLQIKNAYATLAENSRLKKEISRRQETERHLLLVQRRLSHILDSVDEAIIAINDNQEITFCNQSSLDLLGFVSEKLLGTHACSIFAKATQDDLRDALTKCSLGTGEITLHNGVLRTSNDTTLNRQIVITSLEFEEEHLCLLLIEKSASLEADTNKKSIEQSSLQLIAELSRNQKRLRALGDTINIKLPELLENPAALKHEIQAIDTALHVVNQSLIHHDKQQGRRELAVTVMSTCIKYWHDATGLSKADMASESRLWTVYTNKDGWERTQTLDKYLDLTTLPKKPRWNLVISTADFVLTYCNKTSSLREYLENTQIRLRLSCQKKTQKKQLIT